MRLTKLALLSTGLCFALIACRGGGDDPKPDAPPGGSVKIADIQNDAMPVGTAVELRGVVVTALDNFGERRGDFFVQDPAGGPFSGIKVFAPPLDQFATLQVGDIVDITNAEKDEFALTLDMSGRKVTELKGAAGGQMTVTKKGTGAVPAPQVVDAKMIAALDKPMREAEWEKWEGVLIKVTNARQLADTRAFDSTDPGEDAYEFRITGIARVQSGIAGLNTDAAFGVCYDSITGVGDYFFSDLVLPRSAADIVSGGTGCNQMATTITEVQTGTNIELVQLTDVFVTAVSFNKKNFWVTSSLTAAPNQGVYVFRGSNMDVTVLPTEVVPGAKLTIRGAVDEFDGNGASTSTITQVTGPTIVGTVTAPAGLPTPVTGQTAATLNVAGTGEPYEGVYVELTAVKVVDVGTSANFFVGSLLSGGTTFSSDDDILRLVAADVNKCFTMQGIWTFLAFSNKYGFLPITKTETAGACP
ncbi:MAG: hypothetical protein M4D80_17490 [Myxococcota bacterium]|nr:hypothetical protein [Myxococcota bacterium]